MNVLAEKYIWYWKVQKTAIYDIRKNFDLVKEMS